MSGRTWSRKVNKWLTLPCTAASADMSRVISCVECWLVATMPRAHPDGMTLIRVAGAIVWTRRVQYAGSRPSRRAAANWRPLPWRRREGSWRVGVVVGTHDRGGRQRRIVTGPGGGTRPASGGGCCFHDVCVWLASALALGWFCIWSEARTLVGEREKIRLVPGHGPHLNGHAWLMARRAPCGCGCFSRAWSPVPSREIGIPDRPWPPVVLQAFLPENMHANPCSVLRPRRRGCWAAVASISSQTEQDRW